MEHERNATIYSVAASAGVSIATVSRVLKDHDSTSPSCATACCRPSRSSTTCPASRRAASPRAPITPTASSSATSSARTTRRSSSGSRRRPARERPQRRAAGRRLAQRARARRPRAASRVDALAIGPSALPDAAVQRLARRVPVVVVGRQPIEGVDAVVTENASSARALVDHLCSHGRRRLQFAGQRRRLLGRGRALRRRRGGTSRSRAGGAPAASRSSRRRRRVPRSPTGSPCCRRGDRPDAVLCGNDEIALALVQRLGALGLDVPRTFSVTGWDDVHAARYLTPGLTTVRQPVDELGRVAAELLERRLAAPDADPVTRTLPTAGRDPRELRRTATHDSTPTVGTRMPAVPPRMTGPGPTPTEAEEDDDVPNDKHPAHRRRGDERRGRRGAERLRQRRPRAGAARAARLHPGAGAARRERQRGPGPRELQPVLAVAAHLPVALRAADAAEPVHLRVRAVAGHEVRVPLRGHARAHGPAGREVERRDAVHRRRTSRSP